MLIDPTWTVKLYAECWIGGERINGLFRGEGGGENAAAVKSRIVNKLIRVQFCSSPSILVNRLWDLDQDGLRQIRGGPDQVSAQVHKMCATHGIDANAPQPRSDEYNQKLSRANRYENEMV